VSDPSQVLKPGDEVTVKVLRVDAEKQKISLGLKQLLDDPWAKAGETYQSGQLRKGRVTRVAEFGVFVELEPGVQGLVPMSETGVSRDMDVRKAFPVGRDIEVVVLEVDQSARRIRLSVKGVDELRESQEVREYAERADAAPSESLGTLADRLRPLKPRER
jgi:ribosomal protein S1